MNYHSYRSRFFAVFFITSFVSLTSQAHSYNIVELRAPEHEWSLLLIKDHHRLASATQNMEELRAVKNKLIKLKKAKERTLVLVESLWMYGLPFAPGQARKAFVHQCLATEPRTKTIPQVTTAFLFKERVLPCWIDIPLALEIESLNNNTHIKGQSIDPRLPLVKLLRLVEDNNAKNITIKLDDIFALVKKAKKQLDELDNWAENCDKFDIGKDFFAVLEMLTAERGAFKKLLKEIINPSDLRTKTALSKKNVNVVLKNEIEKLKLLLQFKVELLREHAWAQDIETLHRILVRPTPKRVIVAAGGLHVEIIERVLRALGLVEVHKAGLNNEEIMELSTQPLVKDNSFYPIDSELHERLLGAIAQAFTPAQITLPQKN